MLNEQLTRLALFSQQDQPGFAWRTKKAQRTQNLKATHRSHFREFFLFVYLVLFVAKPIIILPKKQDSYG